MGSSPPRVRKQLQHSRSQTALHGAHLVGPALCLCSVCPFTFVSVAAAVSLPRGSRDIGALDLALQLHSGVHGRIFTVVGDGLH